MWFRCPLLYLWPHPFCSTLMFNCESFTMKCLQEEIPVLFELIRSPGYYPKDVLSSFLNELLNRANSPFPNHDDRKGCATTKNADVINDNNLAYFPQLPKVRHRGYYRTDKNTSGPVCKQRSAHPSLLPGVFTLFCQHGNKRCIHVGWLYCNLYLLYTGICYGFEVMRFAESPNVPFTVIYERFPTGYLHCINTII